MSQVITFEDSVKLRIKSIVAELIPEERWEGIVRDTVQQFERVDLPGIIKAELSAHYQAAIKAEFAKPEWQAKFGLAGTEASEAVRKILIDAAPAVLASMIGAAMQNVQQQMAYALQNARGY